ncbi:MAG: hypothetical protein U0797_31135, partial [Gemmataceae bacterium]
MPWHAQGNTSTKLTKPSVAICSWLLTVPVSSLAPENFGGMVPGAKVIQIVQTVNALATRRTDPTQEEVKNDP